MAKCNQIEQKKKNNKPSLKQFSTQKFAIETNRKNKFNSLSTCHMIVKKI